MILGDARCVFQDAEAAQKLFTPDAVIGVNNIAITWPGNVLALCTLHPSRCPDWVGVVEAVRQRTAAGRNKPEVWGHQPRVGIERHTPDWGGSSGLFAVKVALEKGFERIVLAGIPMKPEEAHTYSHRPWLAAGGFHRGWRRQVEKLSGVRSMSGWTRDLLGEPTKKWLSA